MEKTSRINKQSSRYKLKELSLLHTIVIIKMLMVLFFAWQTACINENFNFFESFYGYAGAQNAFTFSLPLLHLANFMDLSASSDPLNHPYYYTNNLDASLLLNTIIAKLGLGKSSYIVANLLTAICRVLALYLYYSVFKSLTKSHTIPIIAILLLATDYLFFDTPLFHASRGNEFAIAGVFLFGLFSYQKKSHLKFYSNPYFYMCVTAVFISNYFGYWVPVALFFLGSLIILFRLVKIKYRYCFFIFLFGVSVPYAYKMILFINLAGFDNMVLMNKIILGTKTPIGNINVGEGLIYSFYDAQRIVIWPISIPSDYINNYINGIVCSIKYLYQAIDYGTIITVLFLFPATICWRLIFFRGRRFIYLHKEEKSIILFMLAIILAILFAFIPFPGYYYFLIAINPYLIMPGICLMLAYVISRSIKALHSPAIIKSYKSIMILFLLVIVLFRILNSVYHYHLLPMEEDKTPKVLQEYAGMPIATTNVNNYPIYPGFIGNYCLYLTESEINQSPPFCMGKSFIVNARDQFEKRKYDFPKAIVIYNNHFDTFLQSINTYPYYKIRKKHMEASMERSISGSLKNVSVDRISYNDDGLIVLKVKAFDKQKEHVYQKLDNIGIQITRHLTNGFNLEELVLIYHYELLNNKQIGDNLSYPGYSKLINWVTRLHNNKSAKGYPLYQEIYQEIKEYEQNVLLPKKASLFLRGLSYSDGHSIILAFMLLQKQPLAQESFNASNELYDTWYSSLPLTLRESAMRIKYYNMKNNSKVDQFELRIMKEILQTHTKNKVYP